MKITFLSDMFQSYYDQSMIGTRRLKNVIFIQTILSFYIIILI